MASSPTPMPDQQGGAPPQGGGGPPPDQSSQTPASAASQGPPSQGPATDLQRFLAQLSKVAKDMASSDPRLASGAQKMADGIQEMQAALVVPQQQTSPSQQPSY